MPPISPFIWSNRNGIPRLEATSVEVTTTAVECMEKTADKKHSNYEERYNEDDDYDEEEDRRYGNRRHKTSSRHRYDNY